MSVAGVRIQHPTERNVVFLMVDGRRPYLAPLVCSPCGKTHAFKTYHLRLDEVGSAVVSQEIIARLQSLSPPMGPFVVVNEVTAPPAQRVTIATPASVGRIVEQVPTASQE